MSKKKAPTKVDRGKCMDLLSNVALLKAAQLKKALKKSKHDTHMLHASGSGDGVSSQPKVPDELQDKTTGTSEGTGTIPGVPDVPKDQSKSENESWGDSEDDDSIDDDNDDVSNDDDNDVDSDADGDNDASDSKRTDSDEDENLTHNQKDDEEEEYEEEYVHTSENYGFTNDEKENVDEEEYEGLYKDVNVRLKDLEHEEGKRDAGMTDASRDDATQEKSYEQVEDDAHVTLTAAHVIQKTEGPTQSSSISSDFASQFLNLDNTPPANNEIVSMMNVELHQPFLRQFCHSLLLPQQSTPTPAPTTEPTTTSIPVLLDFSSIYGFDQRVFVLEEELSQLKQVDHSAQLLKTIKSYSVEFEKNAQAKKKRYIDLIEKSVKDIIKDEVKTQLPHILPKEVSDFAIPVIQSTISESLENVVLAKSSSQPQSTYDAAASLTKFELKKILLDKMQKSKSYRGAQEHRELYNRLVKSYKLDKDLFESYGKAYSLKRDHEDKDKDKGPPARLNQGLKRQKTSMDAEPSKGSKSKISKSSSSKGTKSQPKSSGKSAQAEESMFEVVDTEMPQNQVSDLGNTNDQPNVNTALKHDWFKKPERPLTPNPDWNAIKFVDFRPPQTWISIIARAEKPPLTFDELMSTPIDFSAYTMNNIKIDNLTQEHLVGPAFNLLKGTFPVDYFINNDLEYLKGGISSRKYTNSTTKTKAAKYDDVQGIKDMVPKMFTRRVFILKRVEDLQLGVESYQKKLNITRPETFKFDISNRTPYTAYNNPQGIIYLDKYKRNRLIHTDELYKFSDGTLTSVRTVLHDITFNLRMDYLPKRR
ncbi:hypothetical protein Tco_0505729 [Tanacetum coccineum]